jgi:tetratricopeptide (TPR) repeat protein
MVKAWREIVTIPTYEVGKPEKSPMFLEKRVYQGSSGVVYPYPVIESMSDEKVDKDYLAIWLENEYIKVMVLPELGGRVQMAYDKIKQRHFVYYNHVIKPALVGLLGPWISGGIEFNWPQHHRPTTYMPVDTSIEDNDDGSVTVWVSEMEKMFHQKGMAGFTLRPGCAYLEIKGVLYNRTDVPQTFLWWANPAVEVNDQYQSVFPPDINAVFDHGKRAVSSFPIATGTYYKMDYSAGVDISNYRNIPVPTSYMGVNSHFNFEGGYENDTEAGMLHVASHHFSPGKKQWTWGNGDFGRAWDRNLTDETSDEEASRWKINRRGFRPYIELMAGVYTENQPDFTWLMPYEEKRFVQYFMPYRELGVVKEASKDLVLNISPVGKGQVAFKVFATSCQQVRIVLKDDNGDVYYDESKTLTPEEVLAETVAVDETPFNQLTLELRKTYPYGERPVLCWHAESDDIRPIPDSAEAALLPNQIKTNEQLYLTGLHLEQYRHATWLATDYYEEALRRDPDDIRCLNAMGLWYIRKGRFDRAEQYLRKAVRLSQKRNPNPYDGEPIYNLGIALKYQGKLDEAYERFWKSTWNKAWADAGYFEAAKISTAQGRFEDALDEICRCLDNNWHNHKARALKTAILRKMERKEEALCLIEESLRFDRFNYGCRYEQYLLTGDEKLLAEMTLMMRKSSQNYDELALDYAAAGLRDEASDIWGFAISKGAVSPMTYYYLGRYEEAENTCSDYCFPNRPEDVVALEKAKEQNPEGAKAPYYLGCLYYAARQYDLAIQNWELSAEKDPENPLVWRNLALARFNKQDRQQEALEYMERAFHLDQNDARTLMELDQLYKRMQRPHEQRLQFLQLYPQLVQKRDDLVLEEITLLNQLGRYEEAMEKLDAHQFHPWEGGEGKVSSQYQICRVELAKRLLAHIDDKNSVKRAVKLLSECLDYPHHLGEGKLFGAQENDFYYLLGIAYDALGEKDHARECWEEATKGPQEPAAAMYYNDAKPDKIFYQGLALYKLGREGEAHGRFYRLINYGKQHIFEKQVMDYFAVSLPDLLIWEDSLDKKNLIHCKYMLALGYYGMGDAARSLKYLNEVEQLDINHQGIQQFRTLVSAEL